VQIKWKTNCWQLAIGGWLSAFHKQILPSNGKPMKPLQNFNLQKNMTKFAIKDGSQMPETSCQSLIQLIAESKFIKTQCKRICLF
jgi:hypothetical protein